MFHGSEDFASQNSGRLRCAAKEQIFGPTSREKSEYLMLIASSLVSMASKGQVLEPRSIYILSGPARSVCEHSIPPVPRFFAS